MPDDGRRTGELAGGGVSKRNENALTFLCPVWIVCGRRHVCDGLALR